MLVSTVTATTFVPGGAADFAAAIIARPPVLFLDEPFEGVDAVSARLIRRLLSRYTELGATIVFSSHEMHLVEKLCTRIGIMSHGKLLVEDTPAGLCRRMGVETVEDAFIAAVGGEGEPQDVGEDGVWLSRDFPLGGCFKRIRLADGTRPKTGLSCSVWIPRLVAK